MSRPPVSSARPPAPSPHWNITQTHSSSSKSFHILHRPATASASTSSSPPSRPQTAAPRLQRPVTAKSPFLSYNTAAASPSTSTVVPFSLLDSITAHRASRERSHPSSSRPASAYGRREPRTPDYDLLVLDDEADGASAAVQSSQPQPPQWKLRERQRQDREDELVKYEERKEADDNRIKPTHSTAHPTFTSAPAAASLTASTTTSSASRVPANIAALSTYTPQSFEHASTLQQSIQLLHAAPLLASFLPSLVSLDTAWSSLIGSHSLYRQSESRQMAALRDEELRIRDAMLTFMRVSMEYRRTDVHDAADGRIQRRGDSHEATANETGEDGWLVRDDGQRTTIDVDWNGRYWQSERCREKEAWYRAEERELQSLYEHGVQLVTQLYRRKFELLMRLAEQRSTTRIDAQTQQLNSQLHETLTALSIQSTTAATPSSPSSQSASGSAPLLPPRHPSLSAYAGRLYASLNDLSTLLSSHYQHVLQVVEHSHTLTSASASIDQLVRSLHDEERQRREQVEQLKQHSRHERDESKRREAEWEEKLRLERLEVYKEREQRLRVESQMAELKDTLARIQDKYEADWRRRHSMADKDTQYEVAEVVGEEKRESEAKEAEAADDAKLSTARQLQVLRASKTKSGSGGARGSGKHSFHLSLTTPPSASTASERLSPRLTISPRSASSSSPPPLSPQSRSPRSKSSVFTFAASAAAGGSGSTSAPMSTVRSSADGSGKVMRPALRGGAIADGGTRHGKAASTANAGMAEQMQASDDGKGSIVAGADKLRWDGVPFV